MNLIGDENIVPISVFGKIIDNTMPMFTHSLLGTIRLFLMASYLDHPLAIIFISSMPHVEIF